MTEQTYYRVHWDGQHAIGQRAFASEHAYTALWGTERHPTDPSLGECHTCVGGTIEPGRPRPGWRTARHPNPCDPLDHVDRDHQLEKTAAVPRGATSLTLLRLRCRAWTL